MTEVLKGFRASTGGNAEFAINDGKAVIGMYEVFSGSFGVEGSCCGAYVEASIRGISIINHRLSV